MSKYLACALVCLAACSKKPHDPAFEINAGSGDVDLETELFQSVGAELTGGHSVELVNNGTVFDTLVADITAARTSIDIVIYIWEPGVASTRVSSAIAARARAGVACRVIADAFGSPNFADKIAPELHAAGCDVRMFRPHDAPLQRNHRKIVVVDGHVATIGGLGIRDSWLGDGVHNGGWRDTNVRFMGPAVRDAQQAFAENWQEAGGPPLPASSFTPSRDEGTVKAAIVSSVASSFLTRAERLSQLVIASARRRLWITNAYVVPSPAIIDLLERQAARGVDVRLIVPDAEHDDSKAAIVAQRRLYPRLRKAGVKIWEYQPAMIHSKTMLADDTLSVVGSINLDPLSLNKLDEIALVVEDAGFAAKLDAAFVADCTHATLIP